MIARNGRTVDVTGPNRISASELRVYIDAICKLFPHMFIEDITYVYSHVNNDWTLQIVTTPDQWPGQFAGKPQPS